MSETEAGSPYCLCPRGATCAPAPAPPALVGVEAGAEGAAGAWLAALLALLTLATLVLAVLYLIRRRRR